MASTALTTKAFINAPLGGVALACPRPWSPERHIDQPSAG
jgi:hypothetical protein